MGLTYPSGLCDTDKCVSPNLSLVVGGFNKLRKLVLCGRQYGQRSQAQGKHRAMVKTSRLSLGAQCYSGIQGQLSDLGYREILVLH